KPADDDGKIENDDRNGRSVAIICPWKDFPEDVNADIACGRAGPPAGQHEDFVDGAHGVHESNEYGCNERRCDHWKRDVPEYLPLAGTIDLGLLEGIARQRDEGRYECQGDKRRPVPDVHDDGDDKGGKGAGADIQVETNRVLKQIRDDAD